MTALQGTLKWFNVAKGFGFIVPDDGSKDVFIHITAVKAAGLTKVTEGQRLSYELVTEKGKQAAGAIKVLA